MTERNFLCKCAFCLKENTNGRFLNQNTFNRHHIKIQKFSERDDEDIYIKENIYLDTEESIHLNTEENIHLNTEESIHLDMEENIYLDMEEEQIEKDINNNYDIESLNFNEEDIEYYSDYNYNNNNNNNNNNKSDDDKNDDDR